MAKNNPLFEERPWGSFEILSDLEDHKVKRIIVKPHQRLSLQSHKKRSEHWYVISGLLHVTLNDDVVVLKQGQSVDIPVTTKHRAENKSDAIAVFIEVQTGSYFGEDDIIRYQDDYGR